MSKQAKYQDINSIRKLPTANYAKKAESPLLLEREIIRSGKPRRGWQMWQHMARYTKLLLPHIYLDPFTLHRFYMLEKAHKRGKKIINFTGGQSTGKTQFMTMAGVSIGTIFDGVLQKLGSGTIKAANNINWLRMRSNAQRAWENHKEDLESVGIEIILKKADKITFTREIEFGHIELMPTDKASSLQGLKAPMFFVWLEELTNILGANREAILKVRSNIFSNKGLRIVTSANMNFKEGLDTDFCQPTDKPINELHPDRDFIYNSKFNGVTVRYDSLKALAWNKDGKFKNLFSGETYQSNLDSIGINSPEWMEQVRSFPSLKKDETIALITRAKLEGGKIERPARFVEGEKTKIIGFTDSSLSIRDDCATCFLEIGKRKADEGEARESYSCCKFLAIETSHAKDGQIFTPENKEQCERLKINHGYFSVGDHFPRQFQNALKCRLLCEQYKCPPENYAYDSALSGDITQAMIWAFGMAAHNVDYRGGAENSRCFPPKYKQKIERGQTVKAPVLWSDICKKFSSQIWHQGALLISAGFVRNIDMAYNSRLILELTTRLFDKKFIEGKTKFSDVEIKKEFKKRPPGKSPDHADAFLGALWLAVKLGYLQILESVPLQQNKTKENYWRLQTFNRQLAGATKNERKKLAFVR